MRREDQRANILAREDETEDGEDENYPDDFESYDDNVGGYLDDGDEGSFHAPYTELGYHYSAHNNDTRDSTLYNEAGYDEGGEAYEGDTNVMGADGDLEGSMSDNEMNNVFMYDGSSAVDLMAMQEQPFESYDLDELSRLDI